MVLLDYSEFSLSDRLTNNVFNCNVELHHLQDDLPFLSHLLPFSSHGHAARWPRCIARNRKLTTLTFIRNLLISLSLSKSCLLQRQKLREFPSVRSMRLLCTVHLSRCSCSLTLACFRHPLTLIPFAKIPRQFAGRTLLLQFLHLHVDDRLKCRRRTACCRKKTLASDFPCLPPRKLVFSASLDNNDRNRFGRHRLGMSFR